MNKFTLRISLAIGALITAIIVALITLNFYSFQQESTELNKSLLKEKNANIQNSMQERFSAFRGMLAGVNITTADIQGDSLSGYAVSQLELLKKIQAGFVEDTFVMNRAGELFNSVGEKMTFNLKDSGQDYYQALFEQGETFVVSEPFESAITGKQIIVMTYKLNDNIASLSSIYLDSLLTELVIRDDLFLFTHQGTILIAPYADYIGKNIYDLRPKYRQFSAQDPEMSYQADVEGQSVAFTSFWSPVPINNWQFVTFVKDSYINQGANQQLKISLLLGVFSLLIAIGALFLIVQRQVLKPVGGTPEEIEKIMRTMASGDFRVDLAETGKETGIYHSLILLTKELKSLISNSHSLSESVSSSSEQLNVIMSQSKDNAQAEFSQMEQISTAINELSSTSQEVSEKASMAEHEARTALDSVQEGQLTLEKNIQLTDAINRSVTDNAAIVDELRQFSIEIDSVTEVINSISEQTNLLALNAAIEAARAGEHGRGFAVVADEVRSLASKTLESTVSIQQIIEKLQSKSNQAQENMNQSVGLITESVELADQVKASFEKIAHAVDSISEINTLVATASTEQFSVTEDISQNTTMAFDLVQQNVAGVEETLQAANALSELAEKQKNDLQFFKIS